MVHHAVEGRDYDPHLGWLTRWYFGGYGAFAAGRSLALPDTDPHIFCYSVFYPCAGVDDGAGDPKSWRPLSRATAEWIQYFVRVSCIFESISLSIFQL
jgi:hypothetical protein